MHPQDSRGRLAPPMVRAPPLPLLPVRLARSDEKHLGPCFGGLVTSDDIHITLFLIPQPCVPPSAYIHSAAHSLTDVMLRRADGQN